MVDDQEVIREAFGMLISHQVDIELVGVFSDGDEAVKMAPVLKPDVLIMDVKMPKMDGVTAARLIRESAPSIGIILLSAYEKAEYIREFLKDDPRGNAYLLKHTLGTMDELIRTIHDVAAGRTVLDPIMVERLTTPNDLPEDSPLKMLTRREMEVLALMAKACANQTIAGILYIQPRTVEHHINSIFGKLGISPDDGRHARVQAVLAYLKATGQAQNVSLDETW